MSEPQSAQDSRKVSGSGRADRTVVHEPEEPGAACCNLPVAWPWPSYFLSYFLHGLSAAGAGCLCSRGWMQQKEQGSLLKPWSRGTGLPHLSEVEEAFPPLRGVHKPNTSSWSETGDSFQYPLKAEMFVWTIQNFSAYRTEMGSTQCNIVLCIMVLLYCFLPKLFFLSKPKVQIIRKI